MFRPEPSSGQQGNTVLLGNGQNHETRDVRVSYRDLEPLKHIFGASLTNNL
jgi:hypothetical protein